MKTILTSIFVALAALCAAPRGWAQSSPQKADSVLLSERVDGDYHVKDYLVRPSYMPHPGEGCYISAEGNYLIEMPMGQGSVNFERVFAMLLRQGYDGWFSTEYAGPGDVEVLEFGIRNVRRYYENACRTAAIAGTSELLSAE